jgi:uncharacterized protein (DUF885 family)
MQKVVFALVIAALAAVPALTASAAELAWVAKSNENAKILLQAIAKYAPESASQLGVDGFDDKITDLSHDHFEDIQADRRAALADLQGRLKTETEPKIRQDLEILIDSAKDNMSSEALQRRYFFPFNDCSRRIFGVVQRTLDPRIPKARQEALLIRLEKYTGLYKGYQPFTELAKARTLDRIAADPKLLGPYKGEVEKSIGDAPTLLAGIKDLLAKSGLNGWEQSYAALEKQLTDYNTWVKDFVLPHARLDHKLPPEVYADNLHQFGVDISPQELIARSLTSFAEIRNQMNITAGEVAKERGFPDSDYRAVIRKLKEQQIPADKVMALYHERLGMIEDAIRKNHIATLPERKAVIRLASEAENAQQPAPHMNPPRLIGNTGEYGEFVLTTGIPSDPTGKRLVFDDFTHQAATWSLTAHEARPGHELQFAKMIEAGVSTARAVFAFNSVNAEGWGLYAEAELQPYEPTDGQLIAEQYRMQRAARAFLDPMVNLGQISAEGVKKFLMEEVVLSEGMATQEMQRYTFRAPGQATSYFYGYQRLMQTREEAEVALRNDFSRQAFNDFVISQGLLPPKLLEKAVMEEFVPAQKK